MLETKFSYFTESFIATSESVPSLFIYSGLNTHRKQQEYPCFVCLLVSSFVFTFLKLGKAILDLVSSLSPGHDPQIPMVCGQNPTLRSYLNYWWLKRTKAFIARLRFTMSQRHYVRAKAGVGLVQVRSRPFSPPPRHMWQNNQPNHSIFINRQ